jgi:hypothetical protein
MWFNSIWKTELSKKVNKTRIFFLRDKYRR